MNIGQAARTSGVSAKMIRYYESIGLAESAVRSEGNYRTYGENDIHTLRFIRQARILGFQIEQIRELLALWQDRRRTSAQVKSISAKHIEDLNERIAGLVVMRDTLTDLMRHCAGNHRPSCPILDSMSGEIPKSTSTKQGGQQSRPRSEPRKHEAHSS
ncbi:MAG: Cu(I)-responsive transcriptional regulator [Burkholderiaceae bacterium]|uniref:Cu(I)-responsive transcriptional regulator n=1 Tax=Herminiimonas contaminans TaxID=1111140 RepID=A0ABS0EYJ4_9BURK|nr:Cu(I)-responsive transcriptional regulator [Herminiimonas contaminans]MBF8179643.1 Cu(I)-responsive transcriptional regulator [Herminiimonas contaminans]MBX9798979.1 Cu(I)-responsive transcriptional regulator [Burkholderiaceae bacterium]